MSRLSSQGSDRRSSFLKPRDSWADVLLLERLAVPLTYGLARFPTVTPTLVSATSIALRIVAAGLFATHSLRLGGAIYVLGLLLDGVDGKLARLTARTSQVGGLLDYSADFGAFVALTILLAYGANAPLVLAASCAGCGVASAFATESTGAQRAVILENKGVRGSWDRFTASHRMVAAPGVVEMHLLLFGAAPLFGAEAVTPVMSCATAYFLMAWTAKLWAANGGRG